MIPLDRARLPDRRAALVLARLWDGGLRQGAAPSADCNWVEPDDGDAVHSSSSDGRLADALRTPSTALRKEFLNNARLTTGYGARLHLPRPGRKSRLGGITAGRRWSPGCDR